MNSSKPIYGIRTTGGEAGAVFTSPIVVRYMLDKIGYTPNRDLSGISILEPSCGEGEFVIEIAKRLQASSMRFTFNAGKAFRHNVQAYDIDPNKIEMCRRRVMNLGFTQVENIQVADFLKADVKQTDMVVGNPPYVRYENIPADILEYCKKNFFTFHYRSDIYIPFFEKSLSLLKDGGTHCFICSNRWLKNEYGKRLRQYISNSFQLRLLINLEQAEAFQEDVLAYPAITIITARTPQNVFEYAECNNVDDLQSIHSTLKPVPQGADWTSTFIEGCANSSLMSIEEQGFKIGIGVATGADAVFISDRLPDKIESDLLLPAINARDLKGDKLQWNGKFLFNPYKENGDLIDLDKYPKASEYLNANRDKLINRHIVTKTPARWYRTIDRITPSLRFKPKILLPDMSGNTFVFIDEGCFYPLHNIYYITGNSVQELRVLAAQLMSDFARRQLSSVTNKMNGGFPRWQSQHLRKLRLLDVKSIPPKETQSLLDRYSRKDVKGINELMSKLLSASSKWNITKKSEPIELSLQFAF